MPSQQNSSTLRIPPSSSNPTSISLGSHPLDEPSTSRRTGTMKYPQPHYEATTHVNPWISPGQNVYPIPPPSFCNTYSLGLNSHSANWHMSEPSPAHSIARTGFAPRGVSPQFNPSSFPSYTRSDGSSSHLTPPVVKIKDASPPYRSSRADSNSLTMAKIRRINSISSGYETQKRRKRRRTNSNGPDAAKEKDSTLPHSSWWHGFCQVDRNGDQYNHIYQRNNRMLHGSLVQGLTYPVAQLHSSRSSVSTVVHKVSRRWSCMELRGHYLPLGSQFPCKTAPLVGPTSFLDQLVLKYMEGRPRSPIYTPGTKHQDVIQSIRATLTTFKVPSLEVPDLITLRRASSKDLERMSRVQDTGSGLAKQTALSSSPDRLGDEPSETYIITNRDIDAITELVQATLSEGQFNTPSQTINHMPRAPTFTKKGLDVGGGTIVASITSPAEVQICLSDGHHPSNILHIVSEVTPTAPAAITKKSVHEVIWEGDVSNLNLNTATASKDTMFPEFISSLREVGDFAAPEDNFPTPLTISIPETQDFLDPNCSSPEKNRWPFRSPRDDINMALPFVSDEVDVPAVTPPERPSRPILRSYGASMKVPQVDAISTPIERIRHDSLQDVLSFPPLPSRSSNDWHSPLPPVDPPTLVNSRSLYDIGLDVNCGPRIVDPSDSQILSPQPSRTSWIRTAESSRKGSRVPSVAFDPNYDVCQEPVKFSYSDVPIIEETLVEEEPVAFSCSVPVASNFVAEVSQGIKRVKTIDNVDKGKRSELWTPHRPPSIYPPPVSTSPSERSMDDGKQLCMEAGGGSTTLNASIDSLDLLREMSPSPPSPGARRSVQDVIEQQLSGTREDGNEEPVVPPHVCDDCAMHPRVLS